MDTHHKTRWVLSPMAPDGITPLVADYATVWYVPLAGGSRALVRCAFNAHQLIAVVKDARFVVCDSIHRRSKIHPHIAAHHAEHGLHEEMLLHEALEKLGELHHTFLPEF